MDQLVTLDTIPSESTSLRRRNRVCAGKRAFSDAPKTSVPPPDTARGATADLCDVHHPESVDVVSQPDVRIMQPIFKDLGGRMRFAGQASTVKCFENNPHVRKVRPCGIVCTSFASTGALQAWHKCELQVRLATQHNLDADHERPCRRLKRRGTGECWSWTQAHQCDAQCWGTILQPWVCATTGVCALRVSVQCFAEVRVTHTVMRLCASQCTLCVLPPLAVGRRKADTLQYGNLRPPSGTRAAHECTFQCVALESRAAHLNATMCSHLLQGIIVNGCIRDSEDISKMALGVKALATYPLKSSKRDAGLRDVPVSFAGALACHDDRAFSG